MRAEDATAGRTLGPVQALCGCTVRRADRDEVVEHLVLDHGMLPPAALQAVMEGKRGLIPPLGHPALARLAPPKKETPMRPARSRRAKKQPRAPITARSPDPRRTPVVKHIEALLRERKRIDQELGRLRRLLNVKTK